MKRLRVRATPDPAVAPTAFQLLADSPAVEETRLLEWNVGEDKQPTLLFSVDGDWDGLVTDLVGDVAVQEATATPVDEEQAVLLVTLKPDATPFVSAVFTALTQPGLVITMPVVYRDGTVHATFVGDGETLQSALDAFPSAVAVEVDAVGEFENDGAASLLSDRQYEAVLAGLDLGYYAVPREATHRDVAAALDCAPSTASEHLQKAESKLVNAAMVENRR